MKLGIVGLPNVGKSTLFNAITSTKNAAAANYPFCTIDPNTGIVPVPDARLDKLAEIWDTNKKTPAIVEFVDIAGLVKGASKGEGLGNKFLGNIRECDAIVHVVRCFGGTDIVHVDGSVDPLRDIETIDTELILSDLEVVSNRAARFAKAAKTGDKKAGASAASCELKNAETSPWVAERAQLYSSFVERESGAAWKEANLAVQQIMDSYAAAGPHRLRSATLLTAGLKYMADLRKNAINEISVPDAHSLMRAIETLDLMDNGEIVMHAALERKETRGMHMRSDYTFTNPLLSDKFLDVWQENGTVRTEWRQCWN